MEDAVSYSSADSSSLLGDEFVVVNGNEPRLRISNDGDVGDLVKKMTEVLNDEPTLEECMSADDAAMSMKPGQCSQREVVPLLKTPLGGQRVITNATNTEHNVQNAAEAMCKY